MILTFDIIKSLFLCLLLSIGSLAYTQEVCLPCKEKEIFLNDSRLVNLESKEFKKIKRKLKKVSPQFFFGPFSEDKMAVAVLIKEDERSFTEIFFHDFRIKDNDKIFLSYFQYGILLTEGYFLIDISNIKWTLIQSGSFCD